MDEGKLLEETKPWKIACDLCLHKERTFIPKLSDKNLLCDFHKKIQKKTMGPPPSQIKSHSKPQKPVIINIYLFKFDYNHERELIRRKLLLKQIILAILIED